MFAKMVLRVPDAGLSLEGSAKSMAALPPQAFAVTLDDNVIEDMIACVRNGQDIQLSFGNTPVSSRFFFIVVFFSAACFGHKCRFEAVRVGHCCQSQ